METWTVQLEVRLRRCRAADLHGLEWYGAFRAHRRTMETELARQGRGEAEILIAEVQGAPIGQAFIDLSPDRRDRGVIWAVRVMPHLQNQGIGGRLIAAAERSISGRRIPVAELSVEKDNAGALRLYERLGYARVGEDRSAVHVVDDAGNERSHHIDIWVLRKDLRAPGGRGPGRSR